MGSWKGQKTPGRFMDGWLYKNLDMLSDKIVEDMTFLGIIYSSTLEVGTGKSVLATQIGEAWTELINKKYGKNIPYSVENNVVWKPKDLIEKAKKIPPYSFILLDEWEDNSYWSELGVSLRQFFRKCRQMNLFMICIIPNWFQLPLSYAVSRSIFAIDVRFDDKLDRGNFAFYNFPTKRMLYINGKRQHNYKVCKPTFMGKFPDGYGVEEKEYRRLKREDMDEYDKNNPVKKNKQQIEKDRMIKVMNNIIKIKGKMSNKELGKLIGVSEETIRVWKLGNVTTNTQSPHDYNNKPVEIKDNCVIEVDEEELLEQDKKKISGEKVEEPNTSGNLDIKGYGKEK